MLISRIKQAHTRGNGRYVRAANTKPANNDDNNNKKNIKSRVVLNFLYLISINNNRRILDSIPK